MNTTSAKNPFVVGQWVRGEKFFGREDVIAELLFGPRQALWIAALRRMGKTSLLREVERRVLQSGETAFLPLYWDLEGAIDDATLRESLLAALDETASGLRAAPSWENLSTPEALRQIQQEAKAQQRTLLLLCDEAEALLAVAQNDPHLLARLRRALQSSGNVRCTLTATRRLAKLETLDEAGTSPFLHGFAPPLYLSPLLEAEIQPLLAQASFSLETRKELYQRSGGHPFVLQLLAKRALEYNGVAEAYEHLQHDETLHNFFTVDFNTLSPEEKLLLQQCAQSEGVSLSMTANTNARMALQTLLALGLVCERENAFHLRLPLFKDWLHRQRQSAATQQINPQQGLQPKERVGPYEILQELARGGMGVVYCARDVNLQRLAAVKVLRLELLGDEQHRARFLAEARAASLFHHPHVATIYAIEFKGETPCLCMEYVEGQRLDQWAKSAPRAFAEKLEIARQLASALLAAHNLKLVHRDLKPGNVMVRADGVAKLLDFGIARRLASATRLTHTGQILGTLAYMSPEQASNLETDARSDVFSFGVVLYELFTSQLPFTGENELALAYSLVNENPPGPETINPSLPHALSELILRMLAKLPHLRPQDTKEVLQILEEAKGH